VRRLARASCLGSYRDSIDDRDSPSSTRLFFFSSFPTLRTFRETCFRGYHFGFISNKVTMAIHPTERPPQPAQPIDIQAWTEQATVALSSMVISSPGNLPGSTVSLHIPLDEHPATAPRPAAVATATMGSNATHYKRKEPLRKDSMKRREAILRGKEGSRRRQRWENGTRLPLIPLIAVFPCAAPP
jgi:hypothetical protein